MVGAGCMRWSEMGWQYTENAKIDQPPVGLGPCKSAYCLRAAGPGSSLKTLTHSSKGGYNVKVTISVISRGRVRRQRHRSHHPMRLAPILNSVQP